MALHTDLLGQSHTISRILYSPNNLHFKCNTLYARDIPQSCVQTGLLSINIFSFTPTGILELLYFQFYLYLAVVLLYHAYLCA